MSAGKKKATSRRKPTKGGKPVRGFYNDRVAEGTRTFEVSPDGRRVELTRDEIDHRMIQAAMDLQRGTRPNPMLVQAVSVFLTRWFKEHQVVRRRTG